MDKKAEEDNFIPALRRIKNIRPSPKEIEEYYQNIDPNIKISPQMCKVVLWKIANDPLVDPKHKIMAINEINKMDGNLKVAALPATVGEDSIAMMLQHLRDVKKVYEKSC